MSTTSATDTTTGFLSRAEFDVLVPKRLCPGQPAAFCIVNLLQFRNINYALGHGVGDALLVEAEARLQSVLPPGGLAARVGSRFPLLLPDFGEHEALAFADALRTAFERPLQALGFGCELSVHVGIALAPQHGETYRVLLRKADVALFQAQELGVAVGVYDAQRDPHTPERLALLSELRGAIVRGELQLYCQPKVDMRSGELAGAEALVRWHHPQRGVIEPGEFVPLIEPTDLMMVLTEHMLRASARQGAAWTAQCMHIPLAVNLSTRDVSTLRLSKMLPDILRTEGVASDCLGLEVTESSLLRNPQDSIAELRRLHALGFELYLDDFGTGFSSLSYLADLPIQALKIDHGFTSRMMYDRRAASIVRATIGLAHELGMTVVAEGTADRATWDALQALGCDVAQGYFVARPFPADEMGRWLAASPYSPRRAQ
jgi:diguanylate cyclase (GGDEF)-like protein